MISLTVNGRTPSKKNSKQIIYVRGKPLIISSKDYAQWHKTSLQSLKMTPVSVDSTSCVRLCFYSENRRKFDLSNKAESIMDLLVDAGILPDDNYEIVPNLFLEYGGISKGNPRCEIKIYGKEEIWN